MEQLLLQAQAQLQAAMAGQAASAMGGATPNLASVMSSPWAMMSQPSFPFQDAVPAPAPQVQQQEKTQAPTPRGEGEKQQQQPQQPQINNNMLANMMNLAAMGGQMAAMGGQMANMGGQVAQGMMPFMGGGMMPFGFPFMAMPGAQGSQQLGGSVNNPLNLANSPSQQQQQAPSKTL